MKEDEDKIVDKNDQLATGQDFFKTNEHCTDLDKYEEEKEDANNNDSTLLNKINQMDNIYPGIMNQTNKVNQADEMAPIGSSLLDDDDDQVDNFDMFAPVQ